MPPKPKAPPLIEVYWLDAIVSTSGYTIEEAKTHKLAERRTVGYLLHEDPPDTPHARLILAGDYDPPDECATVAVIWLGCITARKVLRAKQPTTIKKPRRQARRRR